MEAAWPAPGGLYLSDGVIQYVSRLGCGSRGKDTQSDKRADANDHVLPRTAVRVSKPFAIDACRRTRV